MFTFSENQKTIDDCLKKCDKVIYSCHSQEQLVIAYVYCRLLLKNVVRKLLPRNRNFYILVIMNVIKPKIDEYKVTLEKKHA